MNKKLSKKLNNILEESRNFSFENNSHVSSHGIYSRASDDLLSWVSKAEDFIVSNYDEKSGPYKLFETFDRRNFNGYEKSDFDEHLTKLIAALKSCKDIEPNKASNSKNENVIISLITNYMFWTVLVVTVGASYKLGYDNGNRKFEENKIELSEQNKKLKDTIEVREKTITFIRRNSDSAHNILGRMPYDEMKLDTLEFRKVQTNIENAGAALNLNK